MAEKETIIYTAESLDSLEALKTTCERDEAYLGKIIKIELVRLEKSDGEKATAITYEELPLGSGVNLGHLIFAKYKTALEAAQKASELTAAGNKSVFTDPESKTKAFIKNETVSFVAFREKKTTPS